MAAEDFTSASWNNGTPQADEGSDLTVVAGKVDWTDLARTETTYFYRDAGSGHFSADFEHLVEIELTAIGDTYPYIGFWGLNNTPEDIKACIVNSRDMIVCLHYEDDLYMKEVNAGSETNGDKSYQLTATTERWLKIKRVEGSPSYVYCYIYDSAARDNLVDTITLTLSEDQNFQYIYSIVGYDDGGATAGDADGYTKDLDLQEAVGVAPTGVLYGPLLGPMGGPI